MSEKQKTIHNAYCNYEIAKAKSPSRIYSIRSEITRKPKGIKTHNMSKAMIARQLAALCQLNGGNKKLKTMTLLETENGTRYTHLLADVSTRKIGTDVLSELSRKEFEEKFPDKSTCNLSQFPPVFLENGEILLQSEWNGECYNTGNTSYYPVYNQVDEDDFEIIGYYQN